MELSSEQSIANFAERTPGQLAILEGDIRVDYRQLEVEVEQLAQVLRDLGVRAGHVVSIWMPPWWEASAAFNAILRVGAVAHAMSKAMGDDESSHVLKVARPAVIILGAENFADIERMRGIVASTVPSTRVVSVVGRRKRERMQDWVPVNVASSGIAPRIVPGGTALIFTSGTTGGPKGVIHQKGSLREICQGITARFHLESGAVIGMASPIGHIRWILYGALLPFELGGTLLTSAGWHPLEWARQASEIKCSFAAFSPKHVDDLIGLSPTEYEAGCVQVISCGGSYLPTEKLKQAERHLHTRIVRSYGCTEFPSATASDPHDGAEQRLGLDGRALEHVEIRLVPDAAETDNMNLEGSGPLERIQVRGSHAAAGILSEIADELMPISDRDGWFTTSDFGEFIGTSLKVVGRKAELIIRNGVNISAPELETILAEHPLISDLAVVGRQDPIVGERVCLVYVPAGNRLVDVLQLSEYLSARNIAKVRWPEIVMEVSAISRTSSGKIQRRLLWDLANKTNSLSKCGGQVSRGNRD